MAAPGEVVETGVKDDALLLYSEHKECYKKMGLTDQDLEEYARQGRLISYVPGIDSRFYQRKKDATIGALIEEDEL